MEYYLFSLKSNFVLLLLCSKDC